MKGLIQRVTEASVTVNNERVAFIGDGLLLLLGIDRDDGDNEVRELCRRVLAYRVFPDDSGRMNRSLADTGGALLVVPQFTLSADTSSGTRAGFSRAAAPQLARTLFEAFLAEARGALGSGKVRAGVFGADMRIGLINDGPVTFLLEAG